ncbi:AraC family transcriptional regulator [Rhizobium sp. NFR12]|uniref:helix-turn-helix domain-containing protein n=1 Tax=Rhizobium sp. NFR12 TaxID=1566261 RepID=UPI0008A7786B|nr:AraC family transcriptional regulator [Rhizobium sp. NFR12]SEH27210.1 AraC family transcriptional regulator [Rhizobium sp. NFR12]
MSDAIPPEAPHVATADTPVPNWGRLVRSDFGTAAWNRRNAGEISQSIPHHLVLLSFKPFSNRESRLGGTRIRTASAASGCCEIVPAGADYWARWHEPKEVAAFSLSQPWLDGLAQSDLDLPAATVVADALPVVDRRVGLIGGMLRDELRSGTHGTMAGLELDSLLNLLGIHLIRQYGVARPQKDLGGLSDRQFRQVRDHMQAHLTLGVRLEDLASLVGLSSSQLLRSFRRRTGTSPHQYFTRLRLDEARALIVNGPLPLAEIALTCGFSSQSHLTTIMRREDGLTPGALRV